MMRIFKQLCIDFKSDLLFKDTLDYMDEVFGKLGITYDDMGFMSSGSFGTADKVVAKYPALAKYKQPDEDARIPGYGGISSARTDEKGNYTLRVDASEHQILREIVRKTPRPYNFGGISVFLDNVRWFPEINTTPHLVETSTTRYFINGISRTTPPNAYDPCAYMSNCLVLNKVYNYGKKRNPVWFTIETGDEKTGIVDTTDIEQRLSAALGRSFSNSEYVFYFNNEETERLATLDREFAKIYGPLIQELRNLVNDAAGIQHITDGQIAAAERYERDINKLLSLVSESIGIQHIEKDDTFQTALGSTSTSGFSLAKAFKKVLPPRQYKCKGGPPGIFTVVKKNENNHSFALVCDLTPTFKIFRAGMAISGYNFMHEIDFNNPKHEGFEEIYPRTQEEVEYHAANLAAALRKAEAQLSGELLRLYGKSIL
ncbi:MAG: hypothetical protein FWF10_03710 [Clostridiales bacterium]|nr:hypothetical protein [Clostridiales bacterium]